ncbi:MAG: ABC transporter ATP-binding protein, partial [Blautia sp.]|nr:ABC transporter ATP-binding protein [Blautia sp.]
ITIPALAVIIFGLMRITAPLYQAAQSRVDHILGITRGNLTGVRVIRAFGKEQSEIRRFEEADEDLTKMQLFVGRVSALMNPLTYMVVNLAVIAILQMGAGSVDSGILQKGDIVALVNYMSQILVELVKLANLVVLLSKAMACLNRVAGILDTEPAMKFTHEGAKEESTAAGYGNRQGHEALQEAAPQNAVTFSHVSLTYAGAGEESLTDISFTAKRGQTIGVIGGTGSGKSSLVNLIPRFYDAAKGTVTILDRPASQWEKEALRAAVGIVPQKAQLFAGTIRSNLLWGNPEASEEELWRALEIAQAAEVVKGKPLGMEEPVEQGGRNFSGGQKQRLTIARALVRNPQILILDDSASALDFATDAALRKALGTLPETLTVFLVSQRTSSLKHADLILVLEDGHLADQGTHEELLERCEVYREIHESQFRKGEA